MSIQDSNQKRTTPGGKARRSVARRAAIHWRDEVPASIPAGRSIVIEDDRPFLLHLGRDGWTETGDRPSARLRGGGHGVRLDAEDLLRTSELNFTRFTPDEDRWEGVDHLIAVLR